MRRLRSLGDDGTNLRCDHGGFVVLPDSYDRPASRGEAEVHFSISGLVSFELGLPVVAVRLRSSSVLGTAVPEATVDEDGDLLPGEYDIRLHESFRQSDRMMLPEAKAEPVKGRSDRDLRFRVRTPIGSHPDRHLLARRVWVREPCHLVSRVASWLFDFVSGQRLSGAQGGRTYVRD